MLQQNLLIYRSADCHSKKSWEALRQSYPLLTARSFQKALSYLTGEHIAAVITQLTETGPQDLDEVLYLRAYFETVPVILCGFHEIPEVARAELREQDIRFLPEKDGPRNVKEISAAIAEYAFSPDLSVFGVLPGRHPARIKRGLNLILRNFLRKDFSVARIAFFLNVHRCHLEREFQRHCGISPKQLIIGLKLLFAAHLMKNEGMKLLHVAQLAGFDDYFEFCKLFRKHMGMPPGEFRLHACPKYFLQHFKAYSARSKDGCNKTTTDVTLTQ